MQLTRQLLIEKRDKAAAALDNLLAQANVQAGAAEVLDHLIALLDTPEPAKAPEPAKPGR